MKINIDFFKVANIFYHRYYNLKDNYNFNLQLAQLIENPPGMWET